MAAGKDPFGRLLAIATWQKTDLVARVLVRSTRAELNNQRSAWVTRVITLADVTVKNCLAGAACVPGSRLDIAFGGGSAQDVNEQLFHAPSPQTDHSYLAILVEEQSWYRPATLQLSFIDLNAPGEDGQQGRDLYQWLAGKLGVSP